VKRLRGEKEKKMGVSDKELGPETTKTKEIFILGRADRENCEGGHKRLHSGVLKPWRGIFAVWNGELQLQTHTFGFKVGKTQRKGGGMLGKVYIPI